MGSATKAKEVIKEVPVKRGKKPKIKEKVVEEVLEIPPGLKLHLGCGDVILDGFVNVDLHNPAGQVKADVRDLSLYKDEEVDVIYSAHVIEHFHFHEQKEVLKEWFRVLRPGGQLVIECPDLLKLCHKFIQITEQERPEYYVQFHGYPWIPGQTHLFVPTGTQLKLMLEWTGFSKIEELRALRYVNLEDICQCWRAWK